MDLRVSKTARVALCLALSSSLAMPMPSFAAATQSSTADISSSISAMAFSSKNDINSLWANQDGSTGTQLTVKKGGTYYLSADLETSALLAIDAEGKDVVIKLQGHTFTCTERAMGAAFRVLAAKSVTVEGDGGQIIYKGGSLPCGIKQETGALVLKDLAVKSSTDDTHTNLNRHDGCGVMVNGGTLEMKNCQVSVDMSNQSEALDDGSKSLKGGPSGVYIGADAGAATLVGCTVKSTASPLAVKSADGDETSGYAYGLQSLTSKKVTVKGGSYTAVCSQGDALAMRAAKLSVVNKGKKGVVVTAKAGQRAIGIESTAKKGVELDCKLAASYGKAFAADVEAALCSSAEKAFVIGKNFDGKSLGVMTGSDDDANMEGVVAAVLSSKASLSNKQIKSMLVSARTDIASALELKNGSIVFKLKNSNAVAKIGSKKYASFASALAAVKSGQTIRLLASIKNMAITRTLSSSKLITVDLNGKALESASINTRAKVVIEDSTDGKAKISAQNATVLSVANVEELTVKGVKLSSKSANAATTAVSIAASAVIAFEDVTVSARCGKGSAVGINMTGSSSLTLKNSKVCANGDGSSASAYGMKTIMQDSQVSLYGSRVEVNTASGTAGGFEGKGSLALCKNGSDRSKVLVSTSGAASYVFGVNMTSTSGSVSSCVLDDADVSVMSGADSSQGEYWCLLAGSADPNQEARWEFKGACTLRSANDTHVTQYKQPIVIDAGASFSSDVVLNSNGLKKRVIAQAADGSSDITTVASRFVPYQKSNYVDWRVEAYNGNATLRWRLAECVTNTRTSQNYQTLADAIDEASEGDTLSLTADVVTTQTLSIGKAVTIDLSGHQLTMKAGKNAVAGASGSAAAIVYSGSGQAAFKDSTHSGAVNITAGCDAETDTTLGTIYQGVAITGGGTFSLDGCAFNLSYTGAGSTQTEMTLRGVGVVRGALKLSNGASINVSSAPVSQGAVAPVNATGIYASQTSALADGAYSVDIDASSSVNVSNQAAAIERGSIHYAESSSLGDIGLGVAPLARIYPDESSDRYKEIVDKFRKNASLDSSAEGDATYDTQIYYVAPMQLDDGTYIWAFSAPVSANDLGKPESIVPALIFEQSTYQVAAQATGIEGSAAFAGNVRIAGRVSATSNGSGSYALKALGKGAWTLTGSANASGATGSYALATKALDLRDYFDLENVSKQVTYPSSASSSQKVVEQVQAVNQQIASASTAKVVDGSGNEITPAQEQEASQATPSNGRTGKVAVTFANLRAADGSRIENTQVDIDLGSCLKESELPTQPDYTATDGSVYRFAGWAISDSQTIDAQCMTTLVIDDNIKGASKGAVTFSALYVRVEADEHLVTFKNGNEVIAYAVKDGKRPSYGDANAGDAAKIPAHDSKSGYSFTFKGWLAGWNASDVWEQDDGSITTKLPAVTGDVVYTARYKTTRSVQKIYFYSWRKGTTGYSYIYNPASEVQTGDDPTSLANSIAQVGSVVETDDATYVMLGWSVRKTDTQPIYTTSLPAIAEQRWGDSNTYYAIYALSSQTYNVRFMNGDAQCAYASDLKASTSVDAAFTGCGVDKPASSLSGWEFDGWSLTADGQALKGSMVSVAQAYVESGASDGTLVLYAVFINSYRPEVIFKTEGGSIIRDVTVKYGQSVADAGIEPTPTRKAGYYFRGWVTSSGELFDVGTAIDNDIDLTASYTKLQVKKSAAQKAKVSLSKAALSVKRMEAVEAVEFSLADAESSNSVVAKRIAQDKNKVLASYTMDFGYDNDGNRVSVNNGFGTVTMQLPVANGTSVKIYWLRSNGTAGVTATKVAKDGYVSFALADWGAGTGNLVVAKATASATGGFKPIVRPSTNVKPSVAAKPVVKVKKKTAAAKKGAKKTTSTKFVPADQDDAGSGNDVAAQQDQTESTDQESNPAVFYIVLAALVLLIAALVRRLYLFTAKRKEEDLEEDFEDSAQDEQESIRF